jgi:hypothetical protein
MRESAIDEDGERRGLRRKAGSWEKGRARGRLGDIKMLPSSQKDCFSLRDYTPQSLEDRYGRFGYCLYLERW